MADHVQQQILDAVQAALIAAGTAAGADVFLDRLDEIPAAHIAAIDILGAGETGEESIEYQTVHFPPVQMRSYTFAITSITKGAIASAKASRNLAKDVERALLANATAIQASGRAIDMLLDSSEERKDATGATALYAVRQLWQAQYHTLGGAPDVPL